MDRSTYIGRANNAKMLLYLKDNIKDFKNLKEKKSACVLYTESFYCHYAILSQQKH